MTVDEMLELADYLLEDTGPSEKAKKLAQAIKDKFIPNTCGIIDPELEKSGVRITDETPGIYNSEETCAYATALFRKVDELESRDKEQQETTV